MNTEATPQTAKRIRFAVTQSLADMRASMDVESADGAPERNAWIQLERDAISLMTVAYLRNHEQ